MSVQTTTTNETLDIITPCVIHMKCWNPNTMWATGLAKSNIPGMIPNKWPIVKLCYYFHKFIWFLWKHIFYVETDTQFASKELLGPKMFYRPNVKDYLHLPSYGSQIYMEHKNEQLNMVTIKSRLYSQLL